MTKFDLFLSMGVVKVVHYESDISREEVVQEDRGTNKNKRTRKKKKAEASIENQ